MRRNLEHLSSTYFAFSLAVLTLNDFYLKSAFHNFVTGKLSDFVGLFVFAVFWIALFPSKKFPIFFLTAILFTWWKSPFSQPFIDQWSSYLFPIQRTVDLSDLYALSVLPVAGWYLSQRPGLSFINPYLAGIFALFAFCSTSRPQYKQQFEQPQYILLKEPQAPSDSIAGYEGLTMFRLGCFRVIQVLSIDLEREPVKNDDFQKKLVLRDLDTRIIDILGEPLIQPIGINHIVIPQPGLKDSASFKGSRLHGKFIRMAENGKIIIDGFYRDGLEDSVWTFRDSKDDGLTRKTFKNGETIKIESTYPGKTKHIVTVSTRAETVRNKYFQIALLLLLAAGTGMLLVKSYKRAYPQVVQIPIILKLLLVFTLPVFALIFKACLSLIILDAYNINFIEAFFIHTSTYLAMAVLFAVILFLVGIRKQIDLLWYVLLFAIAATAVMEILQLDRLS